VREFDEGAESLIRIRFQTMPRGGSRPNAGRKRNTGKQLHRNTAEQDAQELLEEIGVPGSPKGWKEEIKRIYAACNDPKVQFQIITGLQLRAWGKTDSKSKPAEPLSSSHSTSAERLEQLLTEAVRRSSKLPEPGRRNSDQ
jgi:hypothetical protein